jgi:DNA-binding GntR family transcriptional regulator
MEMITVWAALESMAARLVTEKASDADIASLRAMAAAYDRDDATAHIEEYSEANIAFHQRILELSQCTMLKTIADGLFLHMRAVRRKAMAEEDRSARSVADHIGIIEALEARDADLAAREVREHTMRLHDHVRDTWNDLEETTKQNATG